MFRHLLNLLLLIFLPAMASGQPVSFPRQDYIYPPYRQYTLRDGLPQMQITCLLQDSRGYLWAGTKGGATCYNGERFLNFSRGPNLPDDYIYDLTEDLRGTIWMAHARGLSSWDGNQISSFPSGLPQQMIGTKIAADDAGRIWYLASMYYNASVFGTLEKGKFTDQRPLLPVPAQFTGHEDLVWSSKGNCLIVAVPPHIYEIRDDQARLLYTTGDSMLFLRQQDKELYVIESSGDANFRVLEYTGTGLREAARVRNGKPTVDFLLKKNLRWNDGKWYTPIITLNADTVIYTYLPPEIHKSVILEDRENQLWIGAEEGLFRIVDMGIETWRKEVLPQIWGITEDQQGNIWFASYFSGLRKYDGKKVTALPDVKVQGNPVDYYFRPARDKRGRLFFPSQAGMVMADDHLPKLVTADISLTTFYDPERDLLWSGSHCRADVYDANLRRVRTIGEKEGMENERFVVSIARDRQGWTWLASLVGISRYHWDTRQIVNYNLANGRLPAEGVLSVYTDPMGTTWMGSTNGLLYYDPLSDSIRALNLPDITSPVNFVTSIDSTWLVFSQPAGIYLTDLREYHRSGKMELRFYNDKNGFLGIEPGQDGAFVDSRGNLWMTTGTEVVRLDTHRLTGSFDSLNIRISSCNGELLPYDTHGVTLPRNSLNAILTFDAICFNRPMPVQYAWRLTGRSRGKDTLWSDWSENKYVVLSGLSLRKNAIEVRARIPGLPLKTPAQTRFILETRVALWRQPWFFPALFTLMAFLSLATMVLLLQTRTRMAQANRQAKKFQVQAIQSQMNPHFIFNALASLQTMILQADPGKANDYLVKLAALIRGFLESSLATGYLQGHHHSGEVPLKEELGILNHYIDFQQLIHPGKFSYRLILDPTIDPATFTIPPMLIQPFAENAIRHGLLQKKGEGNLSVSINRQDSGGALITIEDDGVGIEKSRAIQKKSPMRYVSRGRELTLNRIKLMNETGYHISVDTQSSDTGTTVTIQIKNHGK